MPRGGRQARLTEILEGSRIYLGYLLAYMANHYLGPVYKQVEAKLGLTSPEFLALLCIVRVPGINAKDICRASGRPKNSISRAVGLLLEKGLVAVEVNAGDRRHKDLVATATGRRLYQRIEPMFHERQAAMLAVLDQDELRTLDALLKKLAFRNDGWATVY